MNEHSNAKPPSLDGKNATNPADLAERLVDSTQRATDESLEKLIATVESRRKQRDSLLEGDSNQPEATAHRGIEAVRENSPHLRYGPALVPNIVVANAKVEPVELKPKPLPAELGAMLVAAGTGAMLMGLVALLIRSPSK